MTALTLMRKPWSLISSVGWILKTRTMKGISLIIRFSTADLKDKWRNLVRIASLPKAEPAESPRAIDRRRELPAELLERVRFLMELHCSSGAAMGAAERPARPPRRFATLSGDTEAAPSPDSSS
jgi:hypothetical protein